MAQAGTGPKDGIMGNADLLGDLVGGFEANSVDIPGQPIGVSQILPPTTPTDEHRLVAKSMLKIKGLNLDKPGSLVRLSPPLRKKSRF